MANQVDIKVSDHSEEVLREFQTKLGVALNEIGKAVHSHVVDNTPVRTGNLKNSATWEVDDDEQAVIVGFDDSYFQGKPKYAKFVEFGSKHNVAQHMLSRALDSHRREYREIILKVFKPKS